MGGEGRRAGPWGGLRPLNDLLQCSGSEGGGRLLLKGGERGGSWEAVTSPCGQLSLLSWRPHPVHIQWVLGDKLRGTAHKVS